MSDFRDAVMKDGERQKAKRRKAKKKAHARPLISKAAAGRLGMAALRTVMVLRDPNASYQDALDAWNGR
jgi:hypothetical protein